MPAAQDALASGWPRLSSAPRYRAAVSASYADVARAFESLAQHGAAGPFQRAPWLSSWYATHHDARPLLAMIYAEGGEPIMGLPLVLAQQNGLRVIGFADAGLTDYNAPILGRHAPHTPQAAAAALCALRQALPAADALVFEKMPARIAGLPNPLALGADVSAHVSNVLRLDGDFEGWRTGLERTFRKELERSHRVFLKAPGARFERVRDAAAALPIMAALKRQQRERIAALGLPYGLDDPQSEAFYDALVRDALGSGRVVLTTLTTPTAIVAVLLGIVEDGHYAMVRLSTAGEAWKQCSPGRLLIQLSMRHMHGEGARTFDFTIGDYDYKRRFGVETEPLRELAVALSPRGWPLVAQRRARAFVRVRPMLRRLIARVRGERGMFRAKRLSPHT